MNELQKRGFSYILALSVVTFVIVYILDLPTYLSGAKSLVKEYYYDNAINSFIFDIFLITIYISLAMLIVKYLKIKDNAGGILAVILSVIIISSSFMFLFNNGFGKGTFFSKWFKQAGYKAIMYDIILITSTYIIMKILYNKL